MFYNINQVFNNFWLESFAAQNSSQQTQNEPLLYAS